MPDTAKVQVRRKTTEIDELDDNGQPTGEKIVDPDSIVTGISYICPEDPGRYSHLALPQDQQEFQMNAAQAAAAVATGFFEVDPNSKSETEE